MWPSEFYHFSTEGTPLYSFRWRFQIRLPFVDICFPCRVIALLKSKKIPFRSILKVWTWFTAVHPFQIAGSLKFAPILTKICSFTWAYWELANKISFVLYYANYLQFSFWDLPVLWKKRIAYHRKLKKKKILFYAVNVHCPLVWHTWPRFKIRSISPSFMQIILTLTIKWQFLIEKLFPSIFVLILIVIFVLRGYIRVDSCKYLVYLKF